MPMKRFDENKLFMGFFAHLTLPDIMSMTFEFIIHFSGIQKCSLSYACCSPMFMFAHTYICYLGPLTIYLFAVKRQNAQKKWVIWAKQYSALHFPSQFLTMLLERKSLMDKRHCKNKGQKKEFFSAYRSVWFHLHQWRHCGFTSKFKSHCSGNPAMSVIMICLQITILNRLQIEKGNNNVELYVFPPITHTCQ